MILRGCVVESRTWSHPISGQYHEVNPGQYHELNPGQYYEEGSGGLGVKVAVEDAEDAKVYNVQSRVDEFIIGEYGTISTVNGQTLQGVRYTAVADEEVDPNLIYRTLVKYFPMAAPAGDLSGFSTLPEGDEGDRGQTAAQVPRALHQRRRRRR